MEREVGWQGRGREGGREGRKRDSRARGSAGLTSEDGGGMRWRGEISRKQSSEVEVGLSKLDGVMPSPHWRAGIEKREWSRQTTMVTSNRSRHPSEPKQHTPTPSQA